MPYGDGISHRFFPPHRGLGRWCPPSGIGAITSGPFPSALLILHCEIATVIWSAPDHVPNSWKMSIIYFTVFERPPPGPHPGPPPLPELATGEGTRSRRGRMVRDHRAICSEQPATFSGSLPCSPLLRTGEGQAALPDNSRKQTSERGVGARRLQDNRQSFWSRPAHRPLCRAKPGQAGGRRSV